MYLLDTNVVSELRKVRAGKADRHVAAWADLWFYSNPIYIEVKGSTVVAGVK